MLMPDPPGFYKPREHKAETIPGKFVEDVVNNLTLGTLGERAGKAVDKIFNSDDSSKS